MKALSLPVVAAKLDMVLSGRVQKLDAQRLSGIAKTALTGTVRIGFEGIAGDEQADRRHHGGREKALHHYPFDHYPAWRAWLPDCAVFGTPGAFGENFSTSGLNEETLCIGDVLRAGSALLQVSQGRQPCRTLNVRFNHPAMAREVQATGRTGWYYRVLEEGTVHPGDALILEERPHPEWSVARVQAAIVERTLDESVLKTLSTLRHLSPEWRALFARRLAKGQVEDWRSRLGE